MKSATVAVLFAVLLTAYGNPWNYPGRYYYGYSNCYDYDCNGMNCRSMGNDFYCMTNYRYYPMFGNHHSRSCECRNMNMGREFFYRNNWNNYNMNNWWNRWNRNNWWNNWNN
uniref:Matrix protein Y2 n=1 Tax=Pinctada fucata TaxID=50426 RepID=A0A221LBD1_PINFU|nr:matrix protein Y2 [Pinctada fucata]